MVAVALIGAAVIGGATSAVGSHQAAAAANRADMQAANIQNDKTNQALGIQKDTAQQGVEAQQAAASQAAGYLAPARAMGTGSESLLGSLFGYDPTTGAQTQAGFNPSQFYNTPGFRFSNAMGQQAINRGAAAGGNLFTGGTLASLAGYSTGLASQNYNNYVGQLLNQAGLGSQAQATSGQQAIEAGQGIANTYTQQGAQATGALTAAGQGISNAYTNAGQAQASGINATTGAIAETVGAVGNYAGGFGGTSNLMSMFQQANQNSGVSLPNTSQLPEPSAYNFGGGAPQGPQWNTGQGTKTLLQSLGSE